MKNQAYSLEMIMENKRRKRLHNFKQSLVHTQNIITVSSGKGGVGKSTFVTNFSIGLARLGKKVLVMDVDLGLANLHILFNQKKTLDLSHVFSEDYSLREIITATTYGVDLISGGSGLAHLIDLSEEEIWLFLDQIKDFQEYDYIILDVGAGISRNVLTFLRAASQVIVITTPEPTALTDAYGLLKAFLSFNRQRYVIDNFFTVINKSVSLHQSEMAIQRLQQTCQRYLKLDLKELGYLPNDDRLVNSVYQRQPVVDSKPTCQFSKLILNMGKQMIWETDPRNQADQGSHLESMEFENFIKKLTS